MLQNINKSRKTGKLVYFCTFLSLTMGPIALNLEIFH